MNSDELRVISSKYLAVSEYFIPLTADNFKNTWRYLYFFIPLPLEILCIMGKIIGRTEEQNRLTDYIDSDQAEFLVVYGRRRVGKTFFIREFFKNKFAFYMSGAENASKE